MFSEFKKFIARGNVMDMAVGIVVGAAFTAIVTSLVGDIINPVIGLLLGGLDFSEYYINLGSTTYETLDAAKTAGAPVLAYGNFINAIIKFVIVAFAVFMLVRSVNKLKEQFETQQEEAPAEPAKTPEDIVLLTEIRDLLKK
jgi:large conductance mechanosensitive channel